GAFLSLPPPALGECRHCSLARRRVAVRSAKCSAPRRVAKTSASQSTPFARQAAASRAPLLGMRSLRAGYLSSRHDFWPRPLSVGTHPTVTTCKANTEKTPQFLRFTEPGGKWDVGQLVMTRSAAALWQVPGPLSSVGGSGRLRDPRLPDLCLGIVIGASRWRSLRLREEVGVNPF